MSPRKEPEPSDREIPCHPFFVSTLEAKGPLSRPIDTIDVERLKGVGPKKRFVFVDWTTATDLPDERALAQKYGGGTYKLTGKNLDRNCFIRSVILEVDGAEEEEDEVPRAPAAAAPAQSNLADMLLQMMLQDRKESALRHERDLERAHMHSETMLKTVTTFASAAMQMSGGGSSNMKDMMEFSRLQRESETEARMVALAEREAIEESVLERHAAQGGNDGDLIDAALKPIMDRVGSRMADKMDGKQPS